MSNDPPKLSFGQPPVASGTSSPPLFGGTAKPTSSVFGQQTPASTPGGSGGALFGGATSGSGAGLFGTPAASAPEQPKSVFGNTTPASSSVFGGGGASGFSFAQKRDPPFTSAPASAAPTPTTGTGSGSLFGAMGTTGGGQFGAQSLPPSGTQSPSVFAASPAGGATPTSAAVGFNFAQQSSKTPASSAAGTPSMFSQTPSQTPGSTTPLATPFGQTPAGSNTGAASNLFGSLGNKGDAVKPAGSLFGVVGTKNNTSTTQQTTGTGSNVFGGAASTTNSSNTQQTPGTASTLFGGAAKPAPGGFSFAKTGANAQTQPQTSSALSVPASTPQANKTTPQLSFTPAGNPPQQSGAGGGFSFMNAAGSQNAQQQGRKENQQPAQQGQQHNAPSLFGALGGSSVAKAQAAAPAADSAKSGLFGGADAAANTPASTTSGALFGGARPSSSTPASTAGTGGLFSVTAGASQQSKPSFSFPSSSQGQDEPAVSTDTTSVLGGGLFSNLGNKSTAASASGTPATKPPSSAGGLFGALPASAATSSAAQPATTTTTSGPSVGGSLSGAPAATSSPSQPAAPVTGGATFGPTSRLASKSLDEILTTWSASLATHQKSFARLATKISAWDTALVGNSAAVSALYTRAFQAEHDVAEVERQLSLVEHAQGDLDNTLTAAERDVDALLARASPPGAAGPDAERERVYRTAEACAARLVDMGGGLARMVEEVNAASAGLHGGVKSGADDQLGMIVRVLNGHLAQLQVIDGGAAGLARRVEAARREAGGGRGGGSGVGEGGMENFYRSYLGRR